MKKTFTILALLTLTGLSACAHGGFSFYNASQWSSEASNSRNSTLTFYHGAQSSSDSAMADHADAVSVYSSARNVSKHTRNPDFTFYNAADAVSEAQRRRTSTFYHAAEAIGEAQGR